MKRRARLIVWTITCLALVGALTWRLSGKFGMELLTSILFSLAGGIALWFGGKSVMVGSPPPMAPDKLAHIDKLSDEDFAKLMRAVFESRGYAVESPEIERGDIGMTARKKSLAARVICPEEPAEISPADFPDANVVFLVSRRPDQVSDNFDSTNIHVITYDDLNKFIRDRWL